MNERCRSHMVGVWRTIDGMSRGGNKWVPANINIESGWLNGLIIVLIIFNFGIITATPPSPPFFSSAAHRNRNPIYNWMTGNYECDIRHRNLLNSRIVRSAFALFSQCGQSSLVRMCFTDGWTWTQQHLPPFIFWSNGNCLCVFFFVLVFSSVQWALFFNCLF